MVLRVSARAGRVPWPDGVAVVPGVPMAGVLAPGVLGAGVPAAGVSAGGRGPASRDGSTPHPVAASTRGTPRARIRRVDGTPVVTVRSLRGNSVRPFREGPRRGTISQVA
ncbi:hypothetical protein [Nonomuraea roseoviolacea]|uniref:Uncharacterized protein n=1 Tax=Nonomuraea roseoviolacea subsp. carminata TaxID=160689 RepID=A0ABT1KDH1_9ACTN|nr:hypothetical protein [Nonomuraea roseoviolacea]MCP2352066.1 hypothetical protein [Nonomuraea roseoviolacea subsp. carminata]